MSKLKVTYVETTPEGKQVHKIQWWTGNEYFESNCDEETARWIVRALTAGYNNAKRDLNKWLNNLSSSSIGGE